MNNNKAIVLLSGGLDSITVLAIAIYNGFLCSCLSFDYGQRHKIELERAKNISEKFGCEHFLVKLDNKAFSGSSLVEKFTPVPKNQTAEIPNHIASNKVPNTYVPARNTIFLAYALGIAESTGASKILIGCNEIDYSNYPDCRPEYIKAFQRLIDVAIPNSDKKIEIIAPLLHMDKKTIISTGLSLGVDYSMTISCYDPSIEGKACGLCDACIFRKKGFAELGIKED